MHVTLNPGFVFRRDGKAALTPSDGAVLRFSDEQATRINALRRGPAPVLADDLTLMQHAAVVLETTANALRSGMEAQTRAHWADHATIVVMPTEKCDLRCTYCYEAFEKGRMSQDLVAGLKIFLAQAAHGRQSLHLAWFGGEPLMTPDIVTDVSTAFRTACQAAGTTPGVSMTTNGYRLRGGMDIIAPSGLIDVFQITLDGPSHVHDLRRRRADGAGTYDRIIESIALILSQSDARVMVRVNVDLGPSPRLEDLDTWVDEVMTPLRADHGDRIDLTFVPTWNATLQDIDGICLSTLAQADNWLRLQDAWLRPTGRSRASALARTLDRPGALACYAGKPGSYVIGSDGSVYKCSVALNRLDNRIGRLRHDGELEINPELEAVWTSQSALTDGRCHGCAFNLSCEGLFCPLLRLQTGRPPCPTEKRFSDLFLEEQEPRHAFQHTGDPRHAIDAHRLSRPATRRPPSGAAQQGPVER